MMDENKKLVRKTVKEYDNEGNLIKEVIYEYSKFDYEPCKDKPWEDKPWWTKEDWEITSDQIDIDDVSQNVFEYMQKIIEKR